MILQKQTFQVTRIFATESVPDTSMGYITM